MLVVQHIQTTWLKNERGAMHGTLKGKTPEASIIPISGTAPKSEEALVHSVQLTRTSTDVQEKTQIRSGKNLHVGSLHIESSESGAVVDFIWDYRTGGEPVRWQKGRRVWTLNNNEWCRVRYNGRIVLEHTWQYQITTLNVGVFNEIIHDYFERTEPNHYFENMFELL